MNQLVFTNKKGNKVTTSLKVAEIFRKVHSEVYRDIQYLPWYGELYRSNFGHSTYVHPEDKKKYPLWEMTQEGFLFLMTCYNGPKSKQHKEAFLSEFDKPSLETKVMNEIKIFNNSQFGDIRTATTETGEPLFCLTDLCNALNLSNTSVVAKRLDSDEVTKLNLGSLIGETNFVTEPGMYTVILRSSSPLAKPMQKWVTSEVLPSIRKTGGYIQTTENDTPELIMARALIIAQSAIESHKEKVKGLEMVLEQKDRRLEIQANEIKQAVPKVRYYEEVMQSESLITTSVIAKELGMGAVTLNKKLHASGIIYLQSGTWLVYAKYQSLGYTKTKTHTYNDSHGNKKTAIQTVWTEKGREFIHRTLTTKQVAV